MERELRERVAAYIKSQRMICPDDTVAAALSGGSDSVCLLGLLEELREELQIQLCAVHVNHGLRRAADAEEAWVRQLCENKGIPLVCVKVDVQGLVAEQGMSVEEAARELRYQVFEQVEADKVALAHHLQDQAETVLQRMLRGSGLRGLGGMRPVRGRYIRPLLEVDPEELRRYNTEKEQVWIEDESNQDVRYERNRIRHELLPRLEEQYNPAVTRALGRMAEVLQQDEDCLNALARAQYAVVCQGDGLNCAKLTTLHPAIAIRVIRIFLEEKWQCRNLQKEHWEGVLRLAQSEHGRKITLPGGLTLCQSYGILTNHKDTVSAGWEAISLPAAGEVFLPDGSGRLTVEITSCPDRETLLGSGPWEEWLDMSLAGQLVLRTRRAGDYFIASGGHRSLQDFFVDRKIPAEKRDAVWLVAAGSHIVWVAGHRLSDGARVAENSGTALHLRLWREFKRSK